MAQSGAFFASLTPVIRRVKRFAAALDSDLRSFSPLVLEKLRDDFIAESVEETQRQHAFLRKRHFPSGAVPQLFTALESRHIVGLTRSITNAFAQAFDSVPAFANPVRAKTKKRNRRTIQARVTGALRGDPEPDEVQFEGLFGLVRTTTGKRGPRRRIRIRLVPMLEMIQRNAADRHVREFVADMHQFDAPVNQSDIFRISTGEQANSCKTCRALNGRVLTRPALKFAVSRLKPVLFHTNCRHRLHTQGLRGLGPREYDSAKHGPLVTEAVLRAMVRQGVLETQSPQPPSVNF